MSERLANKKLIYFVGFELFRRLINALKVKTT